MAFRLAAAGRPLAEPVHYDGAPHTDALRVALCGLARRELASAHIGRAISSFAPGGSG